MSRVGGMDGRNPQPIAFGQTGIGFGAPAVDPHLSSPNQPIDQAARHPLQKRRETVVHTLPVSLRADLDGSYRIEVFGGSCRPHWKKSFAMIGLPRATQALAPHGRTCFCPLRRLGFRLPFPTGGSRHLAIVTFGIDVCPPPGRWPGNAGAHTQSDHHQPGPHIGPGNCRRTRHVVRPAALQGAAEDA